MTVFAVMLILAGVIYAAAPNLVFDITQSWKNDKASAPSDSYRIFTRVQGVILVIVGIVLIVR